MAPLVVLGDFTFRPAEKLFLGRDRFQEELRMRLVVKLLEAFRDLLRMAIRCGWLATDQILEIILDRIVKAWGPKLVSKEFSKAAETIHNGFGCAVRLLEADPATDHFLKRSAAALARVSRRRSANI